MITFSSVTKKFGSGDFALKNISFHLDDGDFMIISGPSGSGKTTVMKLLIKDLTPTEGEIFYKGAALNDLSGRKLPEHRRKIGVVFQDYRLLPELNVWENIALPLSIIGKPDSEIESRVTDLLSLVALTEKALMFPKQLSGGEAQRVSIARALATGPSLIFADEPTGNLDKKSSLAIVKLLKQINELGTTVILATHDVVVLDQLVKERLLELDNGSLKNDSKPKKSTRPTEKKEEPEEKITPEPEEAKEEKKEAKDQEPKKQSKMAKKADKKDKTSEIDDDMVADFTKEEVKEEIKDRSKKRFGFSLSFLKSKKSENKPDDKSEEKSEEDKTEEKES